MHLRKAGWMAMWEVWGKGGSKESKSMQGCCKGGRLFARETMEMADSD